MAHFSLWVQTDNHTHTEEGKKKKKKKERTQFPTTTAMQQSSPDTKRVDSHELTLFIHRCMEAIGCPSDHAQAVAEILVSNPLSFHPAVAKSL